MNCTHRCVPSGAPCGELLFNSLTITGNAYVLPQFKYDAQDLKQWVGWLLLRPIIEEAVFNAFRRC